MGCNPNVSCYQKRRLNAAITSFGVGLGVIPLCGTNFMRIPVLRREGDCLRTSRREERWDTRPRGRMNEGPMLGPL